MQKGSILSETFEQLITVRDPRSPIAEAYRTLRTNIQFSSLDKALCTMLVTSTSAEEGKSTTLANLAVIFAQAGHRVILVDADLRRPVLHSLFGVPNSIGLTSLFIEDAPGSLPLQETPVPNLALLPSGPQPPNPSELLGSQRMEKVIDALKAEADFVLFDSPPIIAVTDAAVLGRKVDGVLLVVRAGKTRREHAARARMLLEKVNAKVLGAVLTNAKVDSSLYRYYT
jgi:non-specific protein-tyrosine kinase